ncbi:MAG: hypothetical protein AUJ12_07115 [Alphaproteobacteria bacterium CG1_02_46_17]|nr:MAG: hypothetical protein AUJ12_07115 [Alphaproteobacteria bacterium CG1_02_46_17]
MTDELKDLQNRLKDFKNEVSPAESKPDDDKREKNELGKAYELIATPVVAGAFGAGLDHLLETSPMFFISLAILGLLAGFWGIYKQSQNIATPLDLKRLQDAEKKAKTGANFEQNS